MDGRMSFLHCVYLPNKFLEVSFGGIGLYFFGNWKEGLSLGVNGGWVGLVLV